MWNQCPSVTMVVSDDLINVRTKTTRQLVLRRGPLSMRQQRETMIVFAMDCSSKEDLCLNFMHLVVYMVLYNIHVHVPITTFII